MLHDKEDITRWVIRQGIARNPDRHGAGRTVDMLRSRRGWPLRLSSMPAGYPCISTGTDLDAFSRIPFTDNALLAHARG